MPTYFAAASGAKHELRSTRFTVGMCIRTARCSISRVVPGSFPGAADHAPHGHVPRREHAFEVHFDPTQMIQPACSTGRGAGR